MANYELEAELLNELSFEYFTYEARHGQESKKRRLYLGDEDTLENKQVRTREGNVLQLTWNGLTLIRTIEAGTLVEVDVTCDSAFMLRVMPDLGESIRQSMPHVPPDEPIFLQMDNAGKRGTRQAISKSIQECCLKNSRSS